jgi:DNA invertase Pin-like site-specific DNA recombinase
MSDGYSRVSTDGQSVTAQVAELTEAGCTKVVREKASGTRTDRVQLRKAHAMLDADDVLMVTRIGQPARSRHDPLNTLAVIAEVKASFRSLRDTWADSTPPHGRLMQTVIGGLAEFERHLIQSQTSEGRTRAMTCGAKMERKPKLPSHQENDTRARVAAGNRTPEIAKNFNVSHSTVRRAVA